MTRSRYTPYLMLLIGVFAIALSAIFIKWSDAPTSIMGMYRLLFTVILIAPFLRGNPSFGQAKKLSLRDVGLLILAGVFLGLHFLFWMESLVHTSVASSMVLLSLQPVFVAIGSYWLFKERTPLSGAICMGLAIVGSAIIAWGDIGLSKQALYGDLLSILGALAYALYMLTGQSLKDRVTGMRYSFWVFAIAGGLLLIYNIALGISLTNYPLREWGIFLLLALIPTILGQLLFNHLLRYLEASTISMAIVGEPVFAIALAYFMLGEAATMMQIIGGLVTLVGIGGYFKLKYSHMMQGAATTLHLSAGEGEQVGK
ncbi:DMT family transporter [Paenibacillus sp. 1001270B_150601_E10]|uniref:DMT family transporter n=1 Tax=Paenibacillus sp. 1001270B_150601_E10 TaxID=2787079 RepID=UPI002B4C1AD4|nr:DMT family transporter [Paenibacillus sp. 1001270B_150601_E10]